MELHAEGFYKWNVFTLTRHLNWWRKTRRTGQKRPYDAAHIKKQYINTSDWTQEHTLSFLNQLTGMFFLHWEVLLITQRIVAGYLYALNEKQWCFCTLLLFSLWWAVCLFLSVEVMRRIDGEEDANVDLWNASRGHGPSFVPENNSHQGDTVWKP